ncbi:DUF4336 domain-containing protein [Pararhodobacter sp. CCB-MM2]|uniref:DUF4336 domain-containing protein n=1 Tax=Pararhodobacter sp. CCB-MM2 TaxID=1786003 RepID=UPI0008322AE2|nr:DUF4336 domain-containing protein [Pararhodobacter sp. CCB-MM2]
MSTSPAYAPLNTLKSVAPDVWIVDGPAIRFYGLPFTTRMTVIRLPGGGLWVHSPIAVDDALMAEIDVLGPVQCLIAPNWIHYAYVGAWQARYPEARCWAAPGVRERAASRDVAIRIDAVLGDEAPVEWAGVIEQLVVAGSSSHHEAVFFHLATKTLVLTDLIENFERRAVPVWQVPFLFLAGNLDPDGKAPRDMQATFRKGREAARASVERMIGWGPERVILAHGRWYPEKGVEELKRAFRWIL